jgi:hypothetical protein
MFNSGVVRAFTSQGKESVLCVSGLTLRDLFLGGTGSPDMEGTTRGLLLDKQPIAILVIDGKPITDSPEELKVAN